MRFPGPWARIGSGSKWALPKRALGPNGPWTQTGPGPKRALGLNGTWAQTGPGPKWAGPNGPGPFTAGKQ